MTHTRCTFIGLFALILIEGYVVLASEMLAIRLSVPYVGNGTDTISIIIAAVLLPLAFGYHQGDRFRPGRTQGGTFLSVRAKLLRNIMISTPILTLGLSYVFVTLFMSGLIAAGIHNRIVLTALYSGLFLIVPVYLLGQTIPLVSNFFPRQKTSRITGRILFFSTIGSFLGAVLSTLILMSTIGVHFTAAANILLLAVLVLILSRRKFSEPVLYAFFFAALAFLLNSQETMRLFHVVENNQYNTIQILEETEKNGRRHLILNNSSSSMIDDSDRNYPYINFIENAFISVLKNSDAPPLRILVIGAGGFTVGLEDTRNHYDFVDIDGSLKRISEEHFLRRKLPPNKHFHPVPARAYLTALKEPYDLVILDAYFGRHNLPEHLLTAEFFEQARSSVKPGGVVIANLITSPTFRSAYSRHLDNTWRRVFPHTTRQIITTSLEGEWRYNGWEDDPAEMLNVLYIYHHRPGASTRETYTDNLNRVYMDKPKDIDN